MANDTNKITLEVKIKEQTRKVTIEASGDAEIEAYINGCLDANIHPQSDQIEFLSPQGEHSGLDALDCEIVQAANGQNTNAISLEFMNEITSIWANVEFYNSIGDEDTREMIAAIGCGSVNFFTGYTPLQLVRLGTEINRWRSAHGSLDRNRKSATIELRDLAAAQAEAEAVESADDLMAALQAQAHAREYACDDRNCEHCRDNNLRCGDCQQRIGYKESNDTYFHLDDPADGCFLIPAVINFPITQPTETGSGNATREVMAILTSGISGSDMLIGAAKSIEQYSSFLLDNSEQPENIITALRNNLRDIVGSIRQNAQWLADTEALALTKPIDANWKVPFLEMQESTRLAMECAGVDQHKRKEILDTVEDYMSNHFGDD